MKYDIIIVGGGVVGSTLALALLQQTSLSIAMLESQAVFDVWDEKHSHHRVSAISLASKRILQRLDVWQSILNKRVSPFSQIQIWDAKDNYLHFDGNEIAESVLGYIIENNAMQTALIEKLKSYPQFTFFPSIKLKTLYESEKNIELITEEGDSFQSTLAVAADGAQSWLRNAANIDITIDDYEQDAIVATVETEKPHQSTARQVFLNTGPLAFLPLSQPKTSSIVWSLPRDEANRIMTIDNDIFLRELTDAFSVKLGIVQETRARFKFSLRKLKAKNYFKSRVVLVGDAAHTVHPLAGQGLNMGLLDAASLAEIIIDAARQNRNYASNVILRQYERWRKADNFNMSEGIDFIKGLFANEGSILQAILPYGLAATSQLSMIKQVLTRHASGNRAGLPELALPIF